MKSIRIPIRNHFLNLCFPGLIQKLCCRKGTLSIQFLLGWLVETDPQQPICVFIFNLRLLKILTELTSQFHTFQFVRFWFHVFVLVSTNIFEVCIFMRFLFSLWRIAAILDYKICKISTHFKRLKLETSEFINLFAVKRFNWTKLKRFYQEFKKFFSSKEINPLQ